MVLTAPARENWQEAVGFLCRWGLLALAGAVVFCAAWAGFAAAEGIAGELALDVTLPDAVWGEANQARPHMTGYLSTARSAAAPPVLMVVWRGKVQALAPHGGRRIYPGVRGGRPGANPIQIRAIPYGPFAFQHAQATFLLAAAGRPLFLLDARMLPSARQQEVAVWRQCAAAAAGRGEVAMFHPGPLAAFIRARQRLRLAGIDLPVVCSVDPDEVDLVGMRTLGAVWSTWWGRPSSDKPIRPVIVVTSDRTLAASAAGDSRRRFDVHVIDGPQAPLARDITWHASLAKFKESLAAGPIDR